VDSSSGSVFLQPDRQRPYSLLLIDRLPHEVRHVDDLDLLLRSDGTVSAAH